VVKRIVKAHSGSIQVDSDIGKGTTFTIILPEIQPQFVLDAKSSAD
jgi:signal transduction histidine kinase